MKTQIEKNVEVERNLTIINDLVRICISSNNENELRERIKTCCNFNSTLVWGFGRNHFYASENISGDDEFTDENKWERILFVDFTNQ